MKKEIVGIAVLLGFVFSGLSLGEEEVRARPILFTEQEGELAKDILEQLKD